MFLGVDGFNVIGFSPWRENWGDLRTLSRPGFPGAQSRSFAFQWPPYLAATHWVILVLCLLFFQNLTLNVCVSLHPFLPTEAWYLFSVHQCAPLPAHSLSILYYNHQSILHACIILMHAVKSPIHPLIHPSINPYIHTSSSIYVLSIQPSIIRPSILLDLFI